MNMTASLFGFLSLLLFILAADSFPLKRKALTFCKIIEKGGNHIKTADDRWESSS